mmetsp:Transcript_18594/g.55112  ORF Transcript_18594/g.55112 Transcript_18594/m.55112 type:complete len:1651 (+) Transcript_18594:269-5221(+)
MQTPFIILVVLNVIISITESQSCDTTVQTNGIDFEPTNVQITVGQTVCWQPTSLHNVVQTDSEASCTAASPLLFGNATLGTAVQHTFNSEGTFYFMCVPHCGLGMTGQVQVTADSSTDCSDTAAFCEDEVLACEISIECISAQSNIANLSAATEAQICADVTFADLVECLRTGGSNQNCANASLPHYDCPSPSSTASSTIDAIGTTADTALADCWEFFTEDTCNATAGRCEWFVQDDDFGGGFGWCDIAGSCTSIFSDVDCNLTTGCAWTESPYGGGWCDSDLDPYGTTIDPYGTITADESTDFASTFDPYATSPIESTTEGVIVTTGSATSHSVDTTILPVTSDMSTEVSVLSTTLSPTVAPSGPPSGVTCFGRFEEECTTPCMFVGFNCYGPGEEIDCFDIQNESSCTATLGRCVWEDFGGGAVFCALNDVQSFAPSAGPTVAPTTRQTPTASPTAAPSPSAEESTTTLPPTAAPVSETVAPGCVNPSDVMCDDGADCIRPEWRCDGVPDCGDGSDESSAYCSSPPTDAPTTLSPTNPTSVPTTTAPTPAPSALPTTTAPSTSAPTTATPTSAAPSTAVPTTSSPTSLAPTTSTTTTTSSTTTQAPEVWICTCPHPSPYFDGQPCHPVISGVCNPFPYPNSSLADAVSEQLYIRVLASAPRLYNATLFSDDTCANAAVEFDTGGGTSDLHVSTSLSEGVCSALYFVATVEAIHQQWVALSSTCLPLPDGTGCANIPATPPPTSTPTALPTTTAPTATSPESLCSVRGCGFSIAFPPQRACQCDISCLALNDCCEDFVSICQSSSTSTSATSITTTTITSRTSTTATSTTSTQTQTSVSTTTETSTTSSSTTAGPTCLGRCGNRSAFGRGEQTCFCDSACLNSGLDDCCDDFIDLCVSTTTQTSTTTSTRTTSTTTASSTTTTTTTRTTRSPTSAPSPEPTRNPTASPSPSPSPPGPTDAPTVPPTTVRCMSSACCDQDDVLSTALRPIGFLFTSCEQIVAFPGCDFVVGSSGPTTTVRALCPYTCGVCGPTPAPSMSPTAFPSYPPTMQPTLPTASPTGSPTSSAPTRSPTAFPTVNPTAQPTAAPTVNPTAPPTAAPTTTAPTTAAPSTAAPTSIAPTTSAPSTTNPTSTAPTTRAPTTLSPTTEAPSVTSQTTRVPTTVPVSGSTCVAKVNQCHRCVNGTSCEFCREEAYLLNGACVPVCPPGYRSRGQGFYRRNCERLSSTVTCVDKELHCHSCANSTSCSFCREEHYLLDGVCVATCPAGYVERGQGFYRRRCEIDPFACIERRGGCHTCANSSACVLCRDQRYLHGTVCVGQCPTGFVGVGSGNFNRRCIVDPGNACVNRANHCHECNNSTACSFCRDAYYLLEGACVVSCPSEFTPQGLGDYRRVCVPRIAGCAPRQNGCHVCLNATTCSFCREQRYLLNGECVASCPSGYTERGNGNFKRRCVAASLMAPSPTGAPVSFAPSSTAPASVALTSASPTTREPTTSNPTTAVPTTEAPTTASPTTSVPTTAMPTTVTPTTAAPTTASPSTAVPTTMEPTSVAPTPDPTTAVPTTTTPTTTEPTSLAPTPDLTTTAPTTVAPTPSSQSLLQCDGAHGTFRSEFGDCPSYALGAVNHLGCSIDVDMTTGRIAQDVCPQCGQCVPP